jgi:Kef-type K+ transport system membrane component KefB
MLTFPLLAVGLLLIIGYWGGRAANLIKLPRVSGYLAIGILLSPSTFNILDRQLVNEDLYVVTEMALAIIAYTIGGSLIIQELKRLGGMILWVTISQAVGACLLTTVVLVHTLPFITDLRGPEYDLLGTYLPMALVIGAISVATAPGAVIAIVNELKARGPFTSTLLGVIAIDDGLAIIFFALAGTAAHFMIHPGSVPGTQMMGGAVAEIVFSVLLGIVAGAALKFMARLIRRREALLMVILGVIFVTTGIASVFKLSALLANMIVGFIIVNFEARHHDFFLVIEQIEEPLYGLFFGLAGTCMDLRILRFTGLLAIMIMATRITGKQLGTWIAAKHFGAPQNVRRYLGLGLLPKAGVTVGLVLMAREIFHVPEVATILVNAVIGSVILNELIAPPLVKYALVKTGETFNAEENV